MRNGRSEKPFLGVPFFPSRSSARLGAARAAHFDRIGSEVREDEKRERRGEFSFLSMHSRIEYLVTPSAQKREEFLSHPPHTKNPFLPLPPFVRPLQDESVGKSRRWPQRLGGRGERNDRRVKKSFFSSPYICESARVKNVGGACIIKHPPLPSLAAAVLLAILTYVGSQQVRNVL